MLTNHFKWFSGAALGRYLFKPQPPVAQRLQPEAARTLTAAPGALKIGIHMRLGDAEMEGGIR